MFLPYEKILCLKIIEPTKVVMNDVSANPELKSTTEVTIRHIFYILNSLIKR